MGTFRQWLNWIVSCGVIPTAALLMLARHMRQQELAYYLVGVPSLFLYFYVLSRLEVDIPPTEIREIQPEDEGYQILTFKLTGLKTARKVVSWVRGIGFLIGLPAAGVALIFYGVRDGEVAGYLVGPALIWACGGLWIPIVQFIAARRRQARDGGVTPKE